MARIRVTAAMKRQLISLRDARGKVRKGGVMRVPKMLSCDAWEALAAVQQDQLIADSQEDRARPEVVAMPAIDTNAESERDYQAKRAIAARGGLDLVRAAEQRVRELTQPEPPPSPPPQP